MGCKHGIKGACTKCATAADLAARDAEIDALRAEVQRLTDVMQAAHAIVDRNFTFFSGGMVGADRTITRDEVLTLRAAIDAARATDAKE